MQTNAQRYGLILLAAAALFLALSAVKPWAAAVHGSRERYTVTLFGVSRFTNVAVSRWDERRCAWADQGRESPCVATAGHQGAFKALAAAHWLIFLAVALLSWALLGLPRGRVRRAGWVGLVGGVATIAAVLLIRVNVGRGIAAIAGLPITKTELGINAAQFAATLMILAAALLLSPGADS